MIDWLLRRLADRLGVEPARAGEEIVPQLRFEQPWSQGLTLFVIAASAGLIVWLYRREGQAPLAYKMVLAGLRIALVLLVLFMLAEAVLSVERKGLPYFVVMVDDSASMQVADRYEDPRVRQALEDLAGLARRQGGTPGELDRMAIAQGWLTRDRAQILTELQKHHKVRLYLVSTTARTLAEIDTPKDVPKAIERLRDAEPNGEQTQLGDGVRKVLNELRGVAPSAILLLTDGQTTDGEPLSTAAEFAARKGVPLFTIGIGDREPARDLALSDLMVDDVAFVNDAIRFQAKLSSRGFAGREVNLRLRQKGPNDATARDVKSIRVPAPPDGQLKPVEISYTPRQTGENVYTLEVDREPREIQVENNALTRTINVRKETLRVLLVDSEPRYEYRYLKNYLGRDETVQLNVVLLSSDPEYSEQDSAAIQTFPAAKTDLFRYDVIILGDVDPSFLSAAQMANLTEFVTEKGGGLLFIAGENFDPLTYRGTPLEVLLPVELADARNPTAVGGGVRPFRPRLTAEGRTSPIFHLGGDEATSMQLWNSLPELYWYFEAPRKKPGAIVLAEHPEQKGADGPLPIILTQFVGAGKAMFHAVDDTWRWRMRVGDRYFGRFWIQTLRFLARSKVLGQKQAEVTTDRRRYQRSQPVRIRVRFPNPGLAPSAPEVTVQVERKGRGTRKQTLQALPNAHNIFEGVLSQPQEGEYEVQLLPPPVLEGGLPNTSFRVDAPAGELERVQMNEPELIRAAETSGGKYYTPDRTDTLLKDLPRPQKVPLDTDPPIPLWNTWPVLTLFLVLITAEWVLRKRKQMI